MKTYKKEGEETLKFKKIIYCRIKVLMTQFIIIVSLFTF